MHKQAHGANASDRIEDARLKPKGQRYVVEGRLSMVESKLKITNLHTHLDPSLTFTPSQLLTFVFLPTSVRLSLSQTAFPIPDSKTVYS
jgi:hypothetical protein